MIGYIDAVLQRQDKAGFTLKMESFQIENAARRSLKELVQHYETQQNIAEQHIIQLEKDSKQYKYELSKHDTFIKQMQQEMPRLGKLEKFATKLEQDNIISETQTNRKFQLLQESIEYNDQTLNNKIDMYKLTEDKVVAHEQQILQLTQTISDTKQIIFEETTKMQLAFANDHQLLNAKTRVLQEATEHVNFWTGQYIAKFDEHEQKWNNLKAEFTQMINEIKFGIQAKINTIDVESNFRDLSDLLLIKFKQFDSMKESIRDIIVYQKYYYPLQLQQTISMNLQNCSIVSNDQEFQAYQLKQYEIYLEITQNIIQHSKTINDVEIQSQITDLEKKYAQSQLLTKFNPDFTYYLKNKILNELYQQQKFYNDKDAPFSASIRKVVSNTDTQQLILDVHTNSTSLKEQLADIKNNLEEKLAKEILRVKISKHINEKLDVEERVFKRQNSYKPILPTIQQVFTRKTSLPKTVSNLIELREQKSNRTPAQRIHKQKIIQPLKISDSSDEISQVKESQQVSEEEKEYKKFSPKQIDTKYQPLASKTKKIHVQSNNEVNKVIETKMVKENKVIEKTKILVNNEGHLLDHDGNVLTLKYPITDQDQTKMIKIFREIMQATASSEAQYQVTKALDPIRHQIMQFETLNDVKEQQMLQKINSEVTQVTAQFYCDLEQTKELIESNLRTIQKMRARDNADTDKRLNNFEQNIKNSFTNFAEHTNYIQALISTTQILLESTNMQLEAEQSDLSDRQLISLYGIQNSSSQSGFKQIGNNIPSLITGQSMHQSAAKIQMNGRESQQSVNLRDSLPSLVVNESRNQKLAVKVNQNCLSCESSGKDKQLTMKLFKLACLSYQTSKIAYKDETMTREAQLSIRRDLVQKALQILQFNKQTRRCSLLLPNIIQQLNF